MENSAKIRSKLIDSLVLDLIGPSENLMNQFKIFLSFAKFIDGFGGKIFFPDVFLIFLLYFFAKL